MHTYVGFQNRKGGPDKKEARRLQCIYLLFIQFRRRLLDDRPLARAQHGFIFARHQDHFFEDPAKRRRPLVSLFHFPPKNWCQFWFVR